MPDQHVTPPSSFTQQPLTSPPTDKKPFAQARRAITLFRGKQAETHTKQDPYKYFQLAPGEYAEALSGHVNDKIK
jgi:hypothetical protein